MRLTSEEWHDVADLCEQGAVQAENATDGTHKSRAVDKAVEWMTKLAFKATENATKGATR